MSRKSVVKVDEVIHDLIRSGVEDKFSMILKRITKTKFLRVLKKFSDKKLWPTSYFLNFQKDIILFMDVQDIKSDWLKADMAIAQVSFFFPIESNTPGMVDKFLKKIFQDLRLGEVEIKNGWNIEVEIDLKKTRIYQFADIQSGLGRKIFVSEETLRKRKILMDVN